MKSTAAVANANKSDPAKAVVHPDATPATRLGEMQAGQGGIIQWLEGPEDLVRRLMELGLVEEGYVEVVHEAPFGKDPIAVKIRGGLLALRRSEANLIWVGRKSGR